MTIQSIAYMYMQYLLANGFSAESAWGRAMKLIEEGVRND